MKTIFITVFQGVEIRNILRTDIVTFLRNRSDLRIVLFVGSEAKKEYLQKEFHGENIVYEVFDSYKTPRHNKLFEFFKSNLVNTRSLDQKRKIKLSEDKNYIAYLVKLAINRLFARSFFRRIVRSLDYSLIKDSNFAHYFETYKPDAVFLAHLFDDVETSLLREAKKRGVKTIGLINSWDKLTTRVMVRLLPDELIVHNEIIKKEAMKHADMNPRRIHVVGIPHYDYYTKGMRHSREEFCKKFNLDPLKKIVVFCPMGKTHSTADSIAISMVSDIVFDDLRQENLQLIVRFPPNDDTETPANTHNRSIIYQHPGKRFGTVRGVDWDMNFEDLNDLADTLYHANLFICYASSMSIDAAVFDKPVINIGFDLKSDLPLHQNPIRFYSAEHYVNILKTGGIAIVKSREGLREAISNCLKYPETNHEGRVKIIKEQCGVLDGNASERVASFILAELR